MNIGELTATLGVDTSALNKATQEFKQFEGAVQSSVTTANVKIKTQVGLIEEIEQHLAHLEAKQRKAWDYKELVRYNQKIAETKMHLKEYQNAGVAANKNVAQRLSSAQEATAGLNKYMMNLAATIVAAFSVHAISRFVKELIKVGAEAEGVDNAFKKIQGAEEIFRDINKATRGTIENTKLMSLAIKAQNLNIPLQDLAKYLDFATKRAITTGKSIEDLSEIVVRGIGRKSSRAMIELGISVQDLQDAVKETGSFAAGMGQIMERELKEMGRVLDTSAVRLGQQKVAVQNLKEAWGMWLVQSWAVRTAIDYITVALQAWSDVDAFSHKWVESFIKDSKVAMWWMKVLTGATEEEIRTFLDNQDSLADSYQDAPVGPPPVPKETIETLKTLNEQLKEERENLEDIDITNKAALATQKQVIVALEKRIALLSKMPTEKNIYRMSLEMQESKIKTETREFKMRPPEFEEPIDFRKFFMLTAAGAPLEELQMKFADLAAYNKAFGAGLDTTTVILQTYASQIAYTQEQMQNLWDQGYRPGTELMDMYIAKLAELQAAQTATSEAFKVGDLVAQEFSAALSGNIESAKDFANAMRSAAISIVASIIAEAVITNVAKAMKQAKTWWGAIAAGALAGAATKALFSAVIPKFKEGGTVPSGYPNDTYPALLTSGETILPPGELPQAGNVNVRVQDILIDGRKLRIILQKDAEYLNATT